MSAEKMNNWRVRWTIPLGVQQACRVISGITTGDDCRWPRECRLRPRDVAYGRGALDGSSGRVPSGGDAVIYLYRGLDAGSLPNCGCGCRYSRLGEPLLPALRWRSGWGYGFTVKPVATLTVAVRPTVRAS